MNEKLKKIVIIIPWFGPWPVWMVQFLQSCRWNPTIDFVLVGDAAQPDDMPTNVRLVAYKFDEYRSFIAKKLGIKPRWSSPYKLCDFKPTLGYLFDDIVSSYDYWAFSDIDVIYGNIRNFLDENSLNKDVVSCHGDIVSGHLAFIKSNSSNNAAFKRIVHWKYLLEHESHKSFDERIFSLMYLDDIGRKRQGIHRFLAPKLGNATFKEQFSTSLKGLPWVDGTQNYPKRWFWREGRLTADNAGDRDFMYLHFTHWASKRWAGGDKAIWDSAKPLIKITNAIGPFQVSDQGFFDWDGVTITQHPTIASNV